ncbi:YceI family protein [uncultured Desulfobacter sp.]|uniref:YceI family protein n=1 Tax=uncultured Desulfobacter sp. TaxID=240139 RepID=UPI002AAA7ED8|nr:YceI family protein [uncultured Desulfobacter sp.]
MKKVITYVIVAFALFTTPLFAQTWNVDPAHTSADFSIAHMAISRVTGSFSQVTGQLVFDKEGNHPESVDISIDVASIDTGVDQRNEHLKSPDFFDVKKYPTMTYTSKSIISQGKGHYRVQGILTMHGVSKPVTLAVEGLVSNEKDPWGNTRKGAHVTAELNRKDFGIVYNAVLESGNLMIGETVDIVINLEFIKQ